MSFSDDQRLNRRDFVTAAAAAAAGLGILGAAGGTPHAAAQATTQPTVAGLDVGPKESFTKDGPVMKWEKTNHLIVMRLGGKLFAMSSRCTHKRCDIKDASGSFHCPCHNSDFAYDGSVTDGPATRGGPLPRFAIALNDAGHVIVNTKKTFTQAQWNDPASFVPVA